MERQLKEMENYSDIVANLYYEDNGNKKIEKINNRAKDLTTNPRMPITKKVRGLRKEAFVLSHKFWCYGIYVRLFFTYNDKYMVFLDMDKRDDNTYSESKKAKLKRLEKQAKAKFQL